MVPARKLRTLNSRRSTIGCASVSSQTTNSAEARRAATTASATMTGEPNQSSSLPLSSMICSAPTQITISARPTVSIGQLARRRLARGEVAAR